MPDKRFELSEEYRIIRKDGAVRWVDDYGHYTEDGANGGLYYVFISDITEKRERMETDRAVRDAVIQTLTDSYHTVWLINDVETEACSLYHGDTGDGSVHAEAIRNALSHSRYTDTQRQYVATMVAAEDRERLDREISLPYIIRQLSEKEQYSVTFLRDLAGRAIPDSRRERFAALRAAADRVDWERLSALSAPEK